MIIGLHVTLAYRVPEMTISEDEAKYLAKAIADVLAYYPAIKDFLDGKAAAHLALMMAIIQIYGTRIIALQLRLKTEKEKSENVIDMRGQFGPRQGPQGA